MATDRPLCAGCGQVLVTVYDESVGQACRRCGTVASCEQLVIGSHSSTGQQPVPVDGRSITFSHGRLRHEQLSDHRKERQGIGELVEVGRQLGLSSALVEQARHLFQQAYASLDLRYGRMARLVAGSCCRWVLLNNGTTRPLIDVALQLQVDIFGLGRMHNMLRSLLVGKDEWQTALGVVTSEEGNLQHCAKLLDTEGGPLSSLHLGPGGVEEVKVVATRLLGLGREAWIGTGRQPLIVAAAALGLALEMEGNGMNTVGTTICPALQIAVATYSKRRTEFVKALEWQAKAQGLQATKKDVVSKAKDVLQQWCLDTMLKKLDEVEPHAPPLGTAVSSEPGPVPAAFAKAAKQRAAREAALQRTKQHTVAMALGADTLACPLTEQDLLLQRMLLAGCPDETMLAGYPSDLQHAATAGYDWAAVENLEEAPLAPAIENTQQGVKRKRTE